MEGESQAVTFALTARDYADYSNTAMRRMRWFRIGRIVVLVMSGFTLAMNLFTFWLTGEWEDSSVLMAVLFVGALVYPQVIGVTARLRFRSKAFAKVRAPMRIEISSGGLRSTGGIADSMTPWSSIIDIAVTDEATYLFIMKNAAHIVPRHAFGDAAAFDRFVAAARSYWRPAAT